MVMNQWFLRPGWRLNRARIEAWGQKKASFLSACHLLVMLICYKRATIKFFNRNRHEYPDVV